MSDVQNNNQNSNQSPQENDEQVKPVHPDVLKDLFKYKSEAKTLAAELNSLKAQKEAEEKSILEENGKWQDLYKKSEAKLNQILSEREKEKSQFIDSHKKNAVLQTIGGFKKTEYVKFIDPTKIEVREDGSIDELTVQSEAERIRKEYPELIKVTPKSALPDAAPKMSMGKSLKDMSEAEIHAARRAALNNKS